MRILTERRARREAGPSALHADHIRKGAPTVLVTTKVSEDWTRRIWDAQRDRTRVFNGKTYQRIPYGREGGSWAPDSRTCGDCAATRGQLHVPGCDLERCPACRGQMISCGCVDEPPLDGPGHV